MEWKLIKDVPKHSHSQGRVLVTRYPHNGRMPLHLVYWAKVEGKEHSWWHRAKGWPLPYKPTHGLIPDPPQ